MSHRRFKEYRVVHGSNITAIDHVVNAWIGRGWEPQGGITYDNGYFYQAMVKYAVEEPFNAGPR